MAKIIMITGGARSGKSSFAQEFALQTGKRVLFVATATPGDAEMAQRIEAHRRDRPVSWQTLEAPLDVGHRIVQAMNDFPIVIIDCLTLLINNIFNTYGGTDENNLNGALLKEKADAEITALLEHISPLNATFIIVTNEVGLGLVPGTEIGRLYRDMLGRANQVIAREADEAYFMVAGLPVRIKGGGNGE